MPAVVDTARPRTAANRRVGSALVVLLAGIAALGLGLVAAISPALAVVGFFGMIAVGLLLPRGDLAVAAFAASTYFEVVAAGPSLTPVKLLGGIVVVTAALTVVVPSRERRESAWRGCVPLLGLAVALAAWGISSIAWATNASQVQTLSVRLVLDVLVFASVPVLLRSTENLRTLGWWIAGSTLVAAGIGRAIGNETFGRATGLFSDPNEFASATVVGAAFAIALGESDGRNWVRWTGRLGAIAALVAVATSASRTGMAAVLLAFLVLLVTARGVERVRLAGMLGLGVAAMAAWLVLTPAGLLVTERLSDTDSTGRTDLWKVAVYQFQDEPVHGIGLGNYPVRSIEYLRRDVRNLDLFVRAPRTVHNTPLELLAELGVVGFLLFYALVLGCVATVVRAMRRARRARDESLVGACRGILAGIAALMGASLTLSGLYVELQWVLLGACVAAYAVSRERLATRIDVEASDALVPPTGLVGAGEAAGLLSNPASVGADAAQPFPGVTR
jgi:O-antigen ligase